MDWSPQQLAAQIARKIIWHICLSRWADSPKFIWIDEFRTLLH